MNGHCYRLHACVHEKRRNALLFCSHGTVWWGESHTDGTARFWRYKQDTSTTSIAVAFCCTLYCMHLFQCTVKLQLSRVRVVSLFNKFIYFAVRLVTLRQINIACALRMLSDICAFECIWNRRGLIVHYLAGWSAESFKFEIGCRDLLVLGAHLTAETAKAVGWCSWPLTFIW